MMKKTLISFICFVTLIFTSKIGICGDINISSKKGLNYVEGEVVIKIKTKFKSQVSISSVKGLVVCGIFSLSALNKKFKVTSMRNVFTDTPGVKISSVEKERLPDLSTIYLLEFPDEIDVLEVVKAYKEDLNIEYAEPNYICRMFEAPNDTYYSQQWYLPKIKAPEGWNIEKGKDTVLIAVVDSGVDTDHPDLIDKIVIKNGCNKVEGNNDPNPTPNGGDDKGVTHGTHVAGIAAAITNNSVGVAGVAWNCKILPVKVLDDEGDGTSTNICNGIKFAADHVGNAGNYASGVINLSLGGAYSNAYSSAIGYAYARNCVVVAAAGNGGDDKVGDELLTDGIGDNKVSPICNDKYGNYTNMVLGVAAVNNSDNRASFSNYSKSSTNYVEVCAPGVDIYSTLFKGEYGFNNYYGSMQGTSMAAPIVSGLAALIISKDNTASIEEVKKYIVENGDFVGSQNIGLRVNIDTSLTAIDKPPTIELDILTEKEEKKYNDEPYIIKWIPKDEKDATDIFIYYDRDNSGYDGTKIHETTKGAAKQFSWTPKNSGISSGAYYFYAKIDDKVNLPVYCYTNYPLNIYKKIPISGGDRKVKGSYGITEIDIADNTFNKEIEVKIKENINKKPTSSTPINDIKDADNKLKGCENIKINSSLERTISEILVLDPATSNKMVLDTGKSIKVTITYAPNGIDENGLRMFCLDSTNKEWKLVKQFTIDHNNNTIEGIISRSTLEGFNINGVLSNGSISIPTIYKVMGISSVSDITKTIIWPNPFSPNGSNYCYIDNLPNDNEIDLRIFNLAGEKVIVLNYNNGEVLNDGTRLRIKWNGKNSSGDLVAPGLYFYVVKTSNYTKVEKMVIVR
ncbi:MAG: S8 family serine peptidase [bacterium]|nr:S8 family serine peptidase [bacterium]